MENVNKYKNSCRICLKNCENQKFVNIFTTLVKQSSIYISDAINELSGLNVSCFLLL